MARNQPEKGSEEMRQRMAELREKARAAVARGGRGNTTVTLSTPDLEQLARLIKAGYAVLGDNRPISPNLKKAMKRMGVATMGL